MGSDRLRVLPLTPARWADFESLFGPNGACAGCWCQWYRLPARQFEAIRGAKAKARMKALVKKSAPGLLAYAGKEAVGWAALGPREEFARIMSSRLFKKHFTSPAWCVPCLFVGADWRGRGVTVELLKAARKHAKGPLEGYPVVPKPGMAPAFLWWGTVSAFEKAGFKAAARLSSSRVLMRA